MVNHPNRNKTSHLIYDLSNEGTRLHITWDSKLGRVFFCVVDATGNQAVAQFHNGMLSSLEMALRAAKTPFAENYTTKDAVDRPSLPLEERLALLEREIYALSNIKRERALLAERVAYLETRLNAALEDV